MNEKKQLSPESLAALGALNKAYTEAKVSAGPSERPPAGLHGCYITELSVRPYEKIRTAKNGEVPGFFVQFSYITMEPIPGSRNPSEPMEWRGSSRRIVANPAVYAQMGQKDDPEWTLCRDLSEIKDALAQVLQRAPGNLQSDLVEASAKVASSRVAVLVKIHEKANAKNPSEPYWTDYINENITGKQ